MDPIANEPTPVQAPEGEAETLLGASEQAGADIAPQPAKPEPSPADYEPFKMPEGVEYDEASFKEFSTLAKELNLTQEQAQRLVDMHTKQWIGAQAEFEQHMMKMREEWARDTRNHPEFGGKNLDENLSHAKRFIDAFGGDELRKALNETGVGNHPVFFAAFTKAGRLMAEDRLVTGSPGGAGDDSPNTVANRVYRGIKMD